MEFQYNELSNNLQAHHNQNPKEQQSNNTIHSRNNPRGQYTIIHSNRKGNKKLPKIIRQSNVIIIPKPDTHSNNISLPRTIIKYKPPQVNNDDIIEKIIKKNQDIIYIKNEHQQSQKELIEMADKLTEIGEMMFTREQNESKYENKCKELQLAILSKTSMKDKYDRLINKENSVRGIDGIIMKDNKVEALRKENVLLIKQINESKRKYYTLQTKETEEGVTEQKMGIYINEIRTLKNQKNDYSIKLSTNKRTITNTIKEAKRIEDLYQKMKSDINTNEMIDPKISNWLQIIKDDLIGSEEEILLRAENGLSKILTEIETERKRNNSYSLSTVKKLSRNETTSPKSFKTTKYNLIKLNKKVSTKKLYEENTLKTIRPYIHVSSSQPRLNKIPIPIPILNKNQANKTTHSKNEQDFDRYPDYNHASNIDYKDLLNKKEYYSDLNQKVEQSILNVKERAEKKIKELTATLNMTLPQLQDLQMKNNQLKEEILELEKEVSTIETENTKRKKEMKEIKEGEMKPNLNHELYTNTNSPINYIQQQCQSNQNDVFITGSNILQEMNLLKGKGLDIDDDNKSKLDLELETLENRSRTFKFADISNVEKIPDEEEDKTTREKKINQIRQKYMIEEMNESHTDTEDNDNENDIKHAAYITSKFNNVILESTDP